MQQYYNTWDFVTYRGEKPSYYILHVSQNIYVHFYFTIMNISDIMRYYLMC